MDLLQYSLGAKKIIDFVIPEEEWGCIFRICQMQAIEGVVFDGVKSLGEKGIKLPFDILMQWIAQSEQIARANRVVNRNVEQLVEEFKNDGFKCCLLKGQGNTLLYHNCFSRSPGDIDIWITPKEKQLSESERENYVITFLKNKYPNRNLHYNHIDAGVYQGTAVEVHHRPRFMNNMIHNARLQQWIIRNREEQFDHFVKLPETDKEVAIPTWDFNVVFQLAHIYGHVLQSGIGLRQIVDYYYLLKSADGQKSRNLRDTLKSLGLEKIAGAIMWMLHEVLGLEEKYLIIPMDEKRGRMIVKDVFQGGNFGVYDKENIKANTRLKRNIQRIKRDFRLMKYYPSECLWEPVFRGYHFFWRLRYN